jgi:two-component SAPR family response regulator
MALNSENRSNMNKYTSLIPLLYPLNLEGNSWFATLYKNLLLSIFLENPGRSFNSDELINFLYKNYSLKVENVPEFGEILEMLSKEDETLIFQSDKYTMNPGKVAEVEDFYVKVLGIDDQEDGQIQSEYEDSLKAYATIDTEGLLWKSFYNDLFLH